MEISNPGFRDPFDGIALINTVEIISLSRLPTWAPAEGS